ncbi:MAG: CoA-binding protein [Syntrophales bacterium]|jgi:acyl-CoA synthetase (NDP forming)|nr:CoA-binding protein [Syntrophales bacterium]MDY0043238.1 CoA-binding protein [Syntrophales bacterium]
MDLKKLFYPESVAVIGASANLGGGKVPYFLLLQAGGYKGALYPVNPKYKEISGIKAYASIDDLPESIDYAIVAAPVEHSVDIIKSAAKKKIKFVHFFTSGFGETGNCELEKELLTEARRGGVRIIGPNCIGVHCTESRLNYGFALDQQNNSPGNVAFLGQSGGVTGNFTSMAATRKIQINKIVSYGNQIDIRVEDYLDYFADDTDITLIACYIEDIKNAKLFLDALARASKRKPVIILKGGTTAQGSVAAASHTGAMASDFRIWSAAIRQHGGVLVDDFDQMMNLVMLGVARVPLKGKRLGFLGAGGGVSVLFTDMAVKEELLLPPLKESTQKMISEKIKGVNTSTLNPVDLGAFGFDFSVMSHTMKAMDRDENIDIIIPYFSVDYIHGSSLLLNSENSQKTILEMAEEVKKPVLPILAQFTEDNIDVEKTRIETFLTLRSAGFPVFSNIRDAVYSIGKYFEWFEKRNKNKNT